MKKILISCMAVLASLATATAQDNGIANHLSVGIGIGSEGINLSVATCFTDYFEAEVGITGMPKITYKDKADINYNIPSNISANIPTSSKIDINGNLDRTTYDIKASVYPFGEDSKFFFAAGLSFGGEKIMKLSGETDAAAIDQAVQLGYKPSINVGDYSIDLKKNGSKYCLDADARVKKVRPYLGFGFGRLIPKNRIGCRLEIGCQFQGKMHIYANDQEVEVGKLINDKGSAKDIQKIIDNLTVYPVIKFSIRGRIL